MGETIFSRIIRGEIPCHRVYEDEHVLAFLDIGPLSQGHTLVIPKEPAATLDKLSDEASAAVGRVLPRLARAVMQATGATSYNILQNNGADAHQAVFHVHFHIIPKYAGKKLPRALRWRRRSPHWPKMRAAPLWTKALTERIRLCHHDFAARTAACKEARGPAMGAAQLLPFRRPRMAIASARLLACPVQPILPWRFRRVGPRETPAIG
jgi:histidine triad (HIT) family protein